MLGPHHEEKIGGLSVRVPAFLFSRYIQYVG
jgi:hypothetical protein